MIRDLRDPGAAAVIERHRAYWHNETPTGDAADLRPLFSFQPARPMADTADPHVLEPPALLDSDAFRASTERSYDQSGILGDDLIRSISTGMSSEALVGCRIIVRGGTNWAENCLTDWKQLDAYQVRDTIWYQRLMANTRTAVESVDAGQYPFCCMAVRGAVDMAEAMMGGERLCAAIVDHPRELKNLLARITDITIETTLAHSALLPSHRGGQFCSYGIWTPGRTVTFTVDGGCLFSPACYEEFFLPCDQRLCEAYDTPFVHLHAASRQHFAAWTEIPNLGLQCVIDQAFLPTGDNLPIGPQFTELLPDFQAIRARKSLMLYGHWDQTLLEMARAELPPGGSAIVGMVEDPDAMRRQYLVSPPAGET